MKLRKFNQVLHQVFFLPVLTLAAASGALYLQILHANRTVGLIQRSDQRISLATLAEKLIVDEETGLRGYETTRDVRFLQPYLAAQGKLDQVLRSLDSVPGVPGPDGIPAHGIVALKDAHARWKATFAEPAIAAIQAGKDVRDPDFNLRDKELMDSMRAELAGVNQRAEQRRTDRITTWHRQVRWTELALIGLAIGAGGLIGLFTRNRIHFVSRAYQSSLEDLNRRAEEIFESEQRLRTTIASIGDGVITCDPDGRVQIMNTVAEELTGWSQEEARGAPLEQVFQIVSESTRATVENPVTKVRRLKRIVGLANHTALIRRDGTELQIADSGAPIRDKNGEISGIVLVFRDVTMERRSQEALVAQEKLAVAGRLAATIAHEINNPLGSVLEMLYLVRDGLADGEPRQYLHKAEEELKRLGEIVRAMLGLYRESHAPVPIDLGHTMHDVLLLVERRFADMRVRVDADLPPDVCVMGFPAELRQVFTNLVGNAAEAMSEGGEMRVAVFADTREDGGRPVRGATITIHDCGPGIEEQILPQLFQPFFTTKGEKGTGLGLWVSRGIIAKHGGAIELTSSTDPEGHGTTARVFLPAVSALPTGTAPS